MEYEITDTESVSGAVVCAVSAITGREPSSLPLLADALDPDALDALFDTRPNGEPRTGGHLSFMYGGCRITLDNGEYLTVQLLDSHPQVTAGREFNSGDR